MNLGYILVSVPVLIVWLYFKWKHMVKILISVQSLKVKLHIPHTF